MKYILKISAVLFFFFFAGCKKYLDPNPYSITTTDSYYKNASEAETALTGVYAMLLNINLFGQDVEEFMLLGSTDEAGVYQATPDRTPWGDCSYNQNNLMVNNAWNRLFSGVSRANYLLENIGNIKDFKGNRAVEMEAEAKLLRGVYNMYIAEMWGAIPVYLSSVQDPTKARQPISEVYAQIIADFKFAYEKMPNRNPTIGRVNKWTAGGLLARVYTYLASAKTTGVSDYGYKANSFEWVNATDYYNQAKTVSADVLNNSGYVLIPDYSRLFRESTKSDQYQECLLLVEASASPTLLSGSTVVNCLAPPGDRTLYGGGSGQFRPMAELFYKYNMGDFRFKHNLTASIKNSNPPFETISGTKYYVPDTVTLPSAATFAMGKFRQVDPTLKTGLPNYASYLSFPLLRLADVLLLHAEALYYTGDEVGARADLTRLRQRAVKAGYTVNDLNNAYRKTNFVDELLDERTRELCFECIRRFDLARFNKYDAVIKGLSADKAYGFYNPVASNMRLNWKPEKIWWPIPQPQIDLNSNLQQNPGY